MPVRRPKNINFQIKVHHSEYPSLMQISKESRPEKGEAPAIRDTRRGFFRAAFERGGTLGTQHYGKRCRCATLCVPVKFLSSDTGASPVAERVSQTSVLRLKPLHLHLHLHREVLGMG